MSRLIRSFCFINRICYMQLAMEKKGDMQLIKPLVLYFTSKSFLQGNHLQSMYMMLSFKDIHTVRSLPQNGKMCKDIIFVVTSQ